MSSPLLLSPGPASMRGHERGHLWLGRVSCNTLSGHAGLPAMLPAIRTLVAVLSEIIVDRPVGPHVCSKTWPTRQPNSSQQHCSRHHMAGALHDCIALFLLPVASACSGSISPMGNSGEPRRPSVYTILHTRYTAATLACCCCHERRTAPGAASAAVYTVQSSCMQHPSAHALLAATYAASAQASMTGPCGSATFAQSIHRLHA